MNFFQHQDDARHHSTRLVALFALAVIALVVLTNLLIALCLAGSGQALANALNWERIGKVSLAVVAIIAMVVHFKWRQLRGGGRAVAERMGGTPVGHQGSDASQRQLLNVVEEMAIAAGLPVPPVYLLEEPGINAFAAGHSTNDAVLGITRGALNTLSRDQLQGVIAHEFSHILNGDMRLNMRLIAVLAGILFIGQTGRLMLDGGRYRRRSRAAALGLGLLALGYLGVLFGNLIKAAISRQREFLADASAVQYTRNPTGIAEALKLIGGSDASSRLHSGRAEEHSHLFFGSVLRRTVRSRFATHPPLEERIRRIEPGWDGHFLSPPRHPLEPQTLVREQRGEALSLTAATVAMVDRVGHAGEVSQRELARSQRLLNQLPAPLAAASRDGCCARALVLALLIDRQTRVAERQLALLTGGLGLRQRTEQLLPLVRQLPAQQRLPLLELAVPALKQQSHRQQQNFERLIQQLVDADHHVSLFEWGLQRLLREYMRGEYGQPGRTGAAIGSLRQLDIECFEVLSLLAHRGHQDFYSAEQAYQLAVFHLELGPANLVADEQLDTPRIDRALDKLNRLKPLLKEDFLKACAICLETDNKVTATELELLRVFAAILACPMPIAHSVINWRDEVARKPR